MLSQIVDRYYPLKARAAICRVINISITCKTINRRPVIIKMSELPLERTEVFKVMFKNIAVNHFGTFITNEYKTYIGVILFLLVIT